MNPYEKYQQQIVSTMTQGDMLLKLYDETLKQIDIAMDAITKGKVAEMDAAISKAEKIVRYLRSVLDFRYSVSVDLAKFYDFFNTQLVMANVKKDVKVLEEIRPLVKELRDTFDQCVKIDRTNRSNVAAGKAIGNVV